MDKKLIWHSNVLEVNYITISDKNAIRHRLLIMIFLKYPAFKSDFIKQANRCDGKLFGNESPKNISSNHKQQKNNSWLKTGKLKVVESANRPLSAKDCKDVNLP